MENKQTLKNLKVEVVKKVVTSSLIYGSELWTITNKDISCITAKELRNRRKTRRDTIKTETYMKTILTHLRDTSLWYNLFKIYCLAHMRVLDKHSIKVNNYIFILFPLNKEN